MQKDIRVLGSDQFDESLELAKFAFQMEPTPEVLVKIREQYAQEPAKRLGIYVDGQLGAQLTLLELETYIGGKRFAMAGVAGVSTWPEYRRQGLVSELLRHSLQSMREQGQTLSYLAPFAIGFYRKFGWEVYTDNKKYKIEASLMPSRTQYEGRIERQNDNYQLVNRIYDMYAQRYNGTLVRTEFWWNYRIRQRKPGQAAVYYGVDDKAQGYVLYQVKNKEMKIHELIALTEEARQALWSYLAQHDSMIDRAEITVPTDDILAYLLNNPRIKQEVEPYFMARIVDAEAFMSQYPFQTNLGRSASVLVEIMDEHAPWNTGLYKLHFSEDGEVAVRRLQDDSTSNERVRMITDIGSLTAMMLGYRRPLELLHYGRIQGDEQIVAEFDARLPVRTTFLPDFF